jgi:hypothetical protein
MILTKEKRNTARKISSHDKHIWNYLGSNTCLHVESHATNRLIYGIAETYQKSI